MHRIALLGPQRLRPTLTEMAKEMGMEGRTALVTAGWGGLEDEDEELCSHLAGPTVNLGLFRRGEEILAEDPELAAAFARRYARLRQLRELYRLRLDHTMAAARALVGHRGDADLVETQTEEAFAAVRALDREHLRQVRAINAEITDGIPPASRPAVRKHRKEIRRLLAGCGGLAVAGGHVGAILDHLRLFDPIQALGDKPILAWSAGAMALGELVVLFHDRPPQGFGNSEVLDAGLGLYPRIVTFPHARRRLRLSDPARVAALARRLAPRVGLPLDEGEYLVFDGSGRRPSAGLRRLARDGSIQRMEAAA